MLTVRTYRSGHTVASANVHDEVSSSYLMSEVLIPGYLAARNKSSAYLGKVVQVRLIIAGYNGK